MSDITKIKVDGEPESSYQLYPRNEEFAKRAGGNTGSQSGVQPDWNQNDDTKPDYVKNRPFYTGDPVETVLVEESTVSFEDTSSGSYGAFFPASFNAEFGKTYKVSWDGTAYECACVNYNNLPIIGNQSIMGLGADTGEPFIIFNQSGLKETGWSSMTTDTSASHAISISRFAVEIVKINEKYLPKASEDSYGIIKTSDVVSAYNFPANAPHDQMVDAITAFETGSASIVWGGAKVISAYYNSSTDEIFVQFAGQPLDFQTFKNLNGFYKKTMAGSHEYTELPGKQVRIFNKEGTYTVLATEGAQSDTTLHAMAHKFLIYGDIKGYKLVLLSSTNNSKKWFEITVDDSGALKATEVT